MTDARVLRIYLENPMRDTARAGRAGIINRIRSAFEGQGYRVDIVAATDEERKKSTGRNGYHLFHMQDPEVPNTLVLRRAYYFPFWRIEATNARWDFDVTIAPFDPTSIDPAQARSFMRRRRHALFGARKTHASGFIFMPLQGRLTQHRSFQSMSPLAMIAATRKADPDREILLRLHPTETYPPEDITALRQLISSTPGVRLATRPTAGLLADCDYVVTENSSVALSGYFLEKPAVLFAEIDFHHIAASVPLRGIDAAFQEVLTDRPDYARYLWWFFQEMSINAVAADAEDQILNRVRHFGWQI